MKQSSNALWLRIIMDIVRAFLHMKVRGKDNIIPGESAVYVCNHGATIGPVAASIYLPVPFRPWIHDAMLDRELAAKAIEKTREHQYKYLSKRLKNKIIWWITGPVVAGMKSFRPVSVSRTNPLAIGRTLLESVEALQEGDNILLFPDNPEKHYDDNSFRDISTGFTALGSAWAKKTGKSLRFYPVFADKKRRTFTIGAPTSFDPQADERQERFRVAEYLLNSLIEMSEGRQA